jgi:asparagine synthase (glutamine-hydrolysing)
MCGIAGVLYRDRNREISRDTLSLMTRGIGHRGPDDHGAFVAPGVALLHTRLSIVDLAGGHQPISNEDGSIHLVYNGEVYNFAALRERLIARGHTLRTASDTETLVHLYEDHGDALVTRLRGMYAFALWDGRERRLLLARDRVGIKPLYLYRDAEKVIFASEIKAILAHPDVDDAVSPVAIEDYLAYGFIPGPQSIFRRIEKLQPASVVSLTAADLEAEQRRYWHLGITPDERPSAEEWTERLTAKIDETVKSHLMADVPVGAFLSGGLDSSLVVSAAARFTSGPIKTFSIGFSDAAHNELPYARAVSHAFGTEHVEDVVTPDAVTLLHELSYFYDEPFADSSAIPTYLVSKLAGASVKVVLSGDGADEAFGGYARYAHDIREAAVRRLMPEWARSRLLRPLADAWPQADWLPRALRAKTTLTNLAVDSGAAYANTLACCRPPLRRSLLSPGIVQRLNGHESASIVLDAHRDYEQHDALAAMLGVDTSVVLPDDFLVKVDRASMAHGLEARPPFLDHELLELAACIPSRWKVRHGQGKWILRQTAPAQMPREVLTRPKHGFEMPVSNGLRGPLRDMFSATVLSPSSSVANVIHQPTAASMFHDHVHGRREHGGALWALMVLGVWAERYRPSF